MSGEEMEPGESFESWVEKLFRISPLTKEVSPRSNHYVSPSMSHLDSKHANMFHSMKSLQGRNMCSLSLPPSLLISVVPSTLKIITLKLGQYPKHNCGLPLHLSVYSRPGIGRGTSEPRKVSVFAHSAQGDGNHNPAADPSDLWSFTE